MPGRDTLLARLLGASHASPSLPFEAALGEGRLVPQAPSRAGRTRVGLAIYTVVANAAHVRAWHTLGATITN
jgi:hypothetical protein